MRRGRVTRAAAPLACFASSARLRPDDNMYLRSFRLAAALGCLALPVAAQSGIPDCDDTKTTPSGLQWCVLKDSDKGEPPTADDKVKVHYTGWLTDGKKFDSSRDRGKPTEFVLSGVIKGWTEGLQLMRPGMRCKFTIPGDLAYGKDGRPGAGIPPNATLVFDVELLEVMRMPKFRKGDPDKQAKLENGIAVEVLEAGEGQGIGDGQIVSVRYAVWRPDEVLLDCTERQGKRIAGLMDSLPVPFVAELIKNSKIGEVLRAEVPVAVFPNFRTDTIWELELVSVTDMPKFRLCDKEKVVTTQTGLQYEVIRQGEGDSPKAFQSVVAHYTGWLAKDGTRFDSSHLRGEPSTFPLNRVIAVGPRACS